MNSTVQHRIREIVCEQLGVDAAQLLPEASILDDLGADSLDVVELVMALEEAFDIEVPGFGRRGHAHARGRGTLCRRAHGSGDRLGCAAQRRGPPSRKPGSARA